MMSQEIGRTVVFFFPILFFCIFKTYGLLDRIKIYPGALEQGRRILAREVGGVVGRPQRKMFPVF